MHAKFFTSDSGWTWYVTEGQEEDGDFRFFGYVIGFDSVNSHPYRLIFLDRFRPGCMRATQPERSSGSRPQHAPCNPQDNARPGRQNTHTELAKTRRRSIEKEQLP